MFSFFDHRKTRARDDGTTRRQRALRVALCALSLAGACAPTEDPADTGVYVPPVQAGDSGVISTPPAGSDSGVSSPPVGTPMDAGKVPVTPVNEDAALPASDAGAVPASDAGAASDATTSGEGGTTVTGPLTLPDPNMMGPYAVKELDNVGKGFENPINSSDVAGGEFACVLFISGFTTDQKEIDSFSKVPPEYKMDLYTLYYPEGGAPGQKFPVLSWANGTCAHTSGYSDLIKHVVSHGFIVISTHSRFTAGGKAQLRGIDWVFTQDTAMDSPLFGRVNKAQVGVFGHSQGGGSTGEASADMRVKSSVLMHGGSGGKLHAPAFFLTGDGDLSPSGVRSSYTSSRVPAAFGSLKMSDHITMMNKKGHMRMAPEVAAWFRYTLLNDEPAKKWFVGADCVLCKDAEWVYAQKDLK